MNPRRSSDSGSTIPLILGFFLVALLMVAGAIVLGQAFVQQRDLQDVCDGAAAAAAASAADLDRSGAVATASSLQFAGAQAEVAAYVARDPARRGVHIRVVLSPDRRRITLDCAQDMPLALGALFGRGHIHHTATSSARAAVIG